MIYIASDHRGFNAKVSIMSFLKSKGYDYIDLGAAEYDEADDYPDYAFKLGEKVANEQGAQGILLCGSGVGMTVAANKVRGVRAAFVESEYVAKKAKEEDDANVIVLDATTFDSDKDFFLVDLFLNAEFSGAERHTRRRNKVIDYENK